jgi:hypothetical protein
MPAFTLINPAAFVGAVDLTPFATAANVSLNVATNETTTFGSAGFVTRVVGLEDSSFDFSVNQDFSSDGVGVLLPSGQLGTTYPVTVCPETGLTSGASAMLLSGIWNQSTPVTGGVGDVASDSLQFAGTAPFARGQLAHPSAARTTTGNGNVLTFAGPTSTQTLVAHLHVFNVSGTSTPTLTVNVQSAATIGFASPTTRATFTAATAVTSQRLILAGPVTDGFWRVTWSITGGTPSFTFAAAIGIY